MAAMSCGESKALTNKEYEMIQNEVIDTTIFEDIESLQDKQKAIHLAELKSLYEKINKNFKVIDYHTGLEISLSHITLDKK